jgi:protein-L-isoaspartate(D-aspartate) O-methyltransferase
LNGRGFGKSGIQAAFRFLAFVKPLPGRRMASNKLGDGVEAMNVHFQRDFTSLRNEMVEHAIKSRGVRSELVLNAMRAVAPEAFLPAELREFAYEDAPLPIEESQTISQPYIVALMTEALALQGGEKVLEIGTGSGYAAAILAQIAGEVYSVERIGQLAEKAASRLAALGYHNVHVRHADGTEGWPEHAPYDGIVVAAGGPTIPQSLKEQLKVGGRLIIPIGSDSRSQELVRVTRVSESEYERVDLADVRFVPLIGQEGHRASRRRRPRGRRGHSPESSKEARRRRLPIPANRSNQLKPPSSIGCWPGSATRGSC